MGSVYSKNNNETADNGCAVILCCPAMSISWCIYHREVASPCKDPCNNNTHSNDDCFNFPWKCKIFNIILVFNENDQLFYLDTVEDIPIVQIMD